MAVPFMPLSVVFFGAALITKLYFDAEENRNAFRAVTIFIFAGTSLWVFGTMFVTETPLALATPPAEVSTTGGFWYSVYNTFSSTVNVELSMVTFYACSAALGVIGLLGFAHLILHSRAGGKKFQPAAQQSEGPVSPATFPTRAVQGQKASIDIDFGKPVQASRQASASSVEDRVDYIQ